jgi:hypothetical protein
MPGLFCGLSAFDTVMVLLCSIQCKKGGNMTRLLKVAFALALAVCVLGGQDSSAQGVSKDQLVGTWKYAVATNTRPDGSKFNPNSDSATGLLMFDAAGNFSWHIIRPDIVKFASSNRLTGTPEENKAATQGTLSFFGTYSVEDGGKAVTMNIVASSFPNFSSQTQKRAVAIAGDELTVVNQAGASGGVAEVKWKRMK